VLEALERDLEAARYAAERTRRQYDASDPENRLVTAELERRWNPALQHLHEIEVRILQHGVAIDQDPVASGEDYRSTCEPTGGYLDRPGYECAAEEAHSPHTHRRSSG
jgi:hypothetical protein